MKKFLNISLVAALCAITIGCSSLRFPGVYRLKVTQGNYLEQEMIDKLELGMTRRQVRYVMGTPLVQDTFNPNRWDYYFNVRRGEKQLREYKFSVFFEGDTLARWEGDYEPSQKTAREAEKEAEQLTEKADAAKFKKGDDTRF